MSEIDRILGMISCDPSTTTEHEIAAFEQFWNLKAPSDLKTFWRNYGTCKGFLGKQEDGIYLELYTPNILVGPFGISILEILPRGFAPIGSDGSREMIVFREGVGYGIFEYSQCRIEDFVLVAGGFDEFLIKSEEDKWYVDVIAD